MGYSQEVKEFHRYAPGVPQAPEWDEVLQRYMEHLNSMERDPTKHSTGPNRHVVDLAWVVCLEDAKIIDRKTAGRLLDAIQKVRAGTVEVSETQSHGYAERNLTEALGHDEDLASTVNLGRTLQEPMSRLDLRDMMLDVSEELLDLMDVVLEVGKRNLDTVMPGHTHLSQAQPITLSSYLLSVSDALMRAFEQLELAYRHTNRNSGGCGATSGITWPVDRHYMASLLGCDGIVEPAYDAEASQDHSLSILSALTNVMVLLSRSAMDMNIWSMEEVDMLHVDPAWCGVSSMMPQKCIQGTLLERIRIEASYVIGQSGQASTMLRGEPHGDMLPALEPPKIAWHAMARAMTGMGYFKGILNNITPQREQMYEYVKRGFSCSSEIVVHMVKHLDYGPRRAHRIVATMVRMARERGIPAFEVTGELLDEAARFAEETPPGIETDKLRQLLDPKVFIETHSNEGGTAPAEVQRMLGERERFTQSARERHSVRREQVNSSLEELEAKVHEIIAEQSSNESGE